MMPSDIIATLILFKFRLDLNSFQVVVALFFMAGFMTPVGLKNFFADNIIPLNYLMYILLPCKNKCLFNKFKCARTFENFLRPSKPQYIERAGVNR